MTSKILNLTPKKLAKLYEAGERDFRNTKVRGKFEDYLALYGVDTTGSDWRGVEMYQVGLDNSVNRRTNFSGMRAACCSFSHSDNRKAVFRNSALLCCRFSGSDNRDAIFNNAVISSDFKRSRNGGAYFRGSMIEKDDDPIYDDMSWMSIMYNEAYLRGAHIKGADWLLVMAMIAGAYDLGKLPQDMKRKIYSIDFYYGCKDCVDERDVSATQESLKRWVETGGTLPYHLWDAPFHIITSELPRSYKKFVKPAKEVKQEEIEDVKKRLIKFAGLIC